MKCKDCKYGELITIERTIDSFHSGVVDLPSLVVECRYMPQMIQKSLHDFCYQFKESENG